MNKYAEYRRQWRASNPDKVKAQRKRWIDKDPEYAKEKARLWRLKNKEKIYAGIKKWRKNNPDKLREQQLRNREKNPERYYLYFRKSRLKNKYGLSLDSFQELITKQGNKCAICKKDMERICIDHNHKTGEVRGLLCYSCNTGIGLMGDSVEILKQAIVYIGG